MWEASGGRCSVSGIPFDLNKCVASRRRPFAVSIDRIDCSAGYTKENCRIVCVAVNYAMSDWGLGVLERIAYGLVGAKRDAEVKMRGKSVGTFPGIMHRKTPTGLVYEAYRRVDGKRKYLGRFHDRREAVEAIRDSNLQNFTAPA